MAKDIEYQEWEVSHFKMLLLSYPLNFKILTMCKGARPSMLCSESQYWLINSSYMVLYNNFWEWLHWSFLISFRGRASFSKIRIVVPNQWTTYNTFSEGETTGKANIYVTKGSNNQEPGVLRYVKKSKKTYRAILLPDSYINQRYNDAEAVQVSIIL